MKHPPSERLVTARAVDHNPPANGRNVNKIYIATFNVRSLANEFRVTELEYALSPIKWDIIGISEVRRQQHAIEDREKYRLYLYGQTKGRNGIGFLVRKRSYIIVEDFIVVSERAALIIATIYGQKFTIAQVYAPTSSSNDQEIEDFYESLEQLMKASTTNFILLGDMNAQIGHPQDGESRVMGRYGYGKRNNRGELFINFCLRNNLKIMNTLFKKPQELRWTWLSPDGKTKNEIDYIVTNKSHFIENCSVLRNLKHSSDHRLVRATLNINDRKRRPKCALSSQNRFIDREKYIHELSKYDLLGATYESVQDYYEKVENAIIQSSNHAKTSKKMIKNELIMTNKVQQLIDERHALKNKENKSKLEKNILSKIYRKVNREIKTNTKKYRLDIIEKHLENTGAIKKALKHLSRSKQVMTQLQNNSGVSVTNRNDLIKIATDFYRDLYKKDSRASPDHPTSAINSDPVPKLNHNEIQRSIEMLKPDKSPGPDRITNEMLVIGKEILIRPLTTLFNLVLKNKEIPEQWTCSNIVLLYKKGNAKMIENYRPISLTSCVYKVFSATILRRITKILDENQPVEQAGFMRTFSTVDHIFTLKMVLEKYKEYDMSIYLCFIDYSKAFDSIFHESLWEALSQQGVNKEYIDIIKKIYTNSTSKIVLEQSGPSFDIERGVRQGDPLSAKLFIAVLEHVFRRLSWENIGIKIHGRYLSHLRFADDIVLMSEDPNDLQYMVQTLCKESRKVGLEINRGKTKLMTNRDEVPITLLSTNLDYVNEYVYLGHQISFKACTEQEIERRTKSTWNKYWAMKEVFKSKLPVKLKTKAMETCLFPCLTYACQTWALTGQNLQRLRVCQRGIERSFLGLKLRNKIKNSEIRKKTKAIDVTRKVRSLKWKWAGHIQRIQTERWSKTLVNWNPIHKKRRKGRPAKRWDDDIVKVAGKAWSRVARDREKWKELEEAFTAESGSCIVTN